MSESSNADADGSGVRDDAKLAALGSLLTAVGVAMVGYAALRFLWRRIAG